MITVLTLLGLTFLTTFLLGIPKTRHIPHDADDVLRRLDKAEADLSIIEQKLNK